MTTSQPRVTITRVEVASPYGPRNAKTMNRLSCRCGGRGLITGTPSQAAEFARTWHSGC